MQSTANKESSDRARLGSGTELATEAQIEEYVEGFSAALNRLYEQRGVPAAVHARLRSSTSADVRASNSTPQQCSGQTSSSAASCSSVSSQSLPAVTSTLDNLMLMSGSDSHVHSSTTIPLCVTRLESNFSDDHPLDDQQQQQQLTNCRRNSTGIYEQVVVKVKVKVAILVIALLT